VGVNVARNLLQMGHEVVLVEQRKYRYEWLLEEFEEKLFRGDGTEIWVLEKVGISRADMVVTVTGDDEDNLIIAQIAKFKYGVPKVVARVNNPFNQPTFDLLGVDATVCATTALLSMIRHELPVHKFVHLLSLRKENIEVVELEVGETSAFAHKRVEEISLPEGVLLSAVLRGGTSILARSAVEILPGDYVLCLIEPGKETELISVFMPEESAEKVRGESELDVSEG